MKYLINLLFAYLGNAISVILTVLTGFYMFGIVKHNPSFFEPFYSPLHWIIIFTVLNIIELTVLFTITGLCLKLLRIPLEFTPKQYILIGFFFSLSYLVTQFLIPKANSIFNNFFVIFVLIPLMIFSVLFFIFRV